MINAKLKNSFYLLKNYPMKSKYFIQEINTSPNNNKTYCKISLLPLIIELTNNTFSGFYFVIKDYDYYVKSNIVADIFNVDYKSTNFYCCLYGVPLTPHKRYTYFYIHGDNMYRETPYDARVIKSIKMQNATEINQILGIK